MGASTIPSPLAERAHHVKASIHDLACQRILDPV